MERLGINDTNPSDQGNFDNDAGDSGLGVMETRLVGTNLGIIDELVDNYQMIIENVED